MIGCDFFLGLSLRSSCVRLSSVPGKEDELAPHSCDSFEDCWCRETEWNDRIKINITTLPSFRSWWSPSHWQRLKRSDLRDWPYWCPNCKGQETTPYDDGFDDWMPKVRNSTRSTSVVWRGWGSEKDVFRPYAWRGPCGREQLNEIFSKLESSMYIERGRVQSEDKGHTKTTLCKQRSCPLVHQGTLSDRSPTSTMHQTAMWCPECVKG